MFFYIILFALIPVKQFLLKLLIESLNKLTD